MDALGFLFELCLQFMKQEFVVYGHSVSYWGVFLLAALVEIVCLLIGGFFSGK